MINITVDKNKYHIPNKLNELTIGAYQKIKDIKPDDKIKYVSEILNKLGNIPYDVILKMNSYEIKVIVNAITVMLNNTDQPLRNYIVIDDVKYKFQDNLDTMRFDQFIDLSEMTDNKELINDNIHLIMSILYHKVIGKEKSKFKWYKPWKKRSYKDILEPYDSTKVYDKAKLFKEHLTMDIVYGVLVFFSHLKLIYLKNSLDYLKSQIPDQNSQTNDLDLK